jgi:hypothetical protein
MQIRNFFSGFAEFILDAGWWGMSSEAAAIVAYVFAIYEHSKEKPLTGWVFLVLSVILFWLGSFLAWSHKNNAEKVLQSRVEQLEKRVMDVPSLRVVQHGFYTDIRPLVEQVGPVFRPLAQLSCLHVKFKNDPQLATDGSIARNVLAELEFFDESGHLLCAFLGRWGDMPQPPHLPQGQSPAQTLAMADFGIGQERELDIAFKYQDESDCFGMSNETYSYRDWRHPKQRLVSEDVKVRIRLRGIGADSSWDFWFHNPKSGSLQRIKYQQASPRRERTV